MKSKYSYLKEAYGDLALDLISKEILISNDISSKLYSDEDKVADAAKIQDALDALAYSTLKDYGKKPHSYAWKDNPYKTEKIDISGSTMYKDEDLITTDKTVAVTTDDQGYTHKAAEVVEPTPGMYKIVKEAQKFKVIPHGMLDGWVGTCTECGSVAVPLTNITSEIAVEKDMLHMGNIVFIRITVICDNCGKKVGDLTLKHITS